VEVRAAEELRRESGFLPSLRGRESVRKTQQGEAPGNGGEGGMGTGKRTFVSRMQ